MKIHTASMTSRHFIIQVALLIIVASCTSSCKGVVKKIGKETIGEVAEESSEVVSKKGGKSVAKTAGKDFVRNMGWDDLLLVLRKENPTLARSMDHVRSSVKREIADVVSLDDHFLASLKTSRTLVDEYSLFTDQAPKLADNVDFFRLFAKADYAEKSFGKTNVLKNITIVR